MSDSNSNGTPARIKSERWEFHDQFLPARLCVLLRDKTITAADLLILFVVSGGTRHFDDGAGKGCYASNEYIGEAVGRACPSYVSERVSHLRKLGLLLVVEVNGKRYLETEWGRTAEERAGLAGEYGETLRRAHARTLKRLGEGMLGGFGKTRRGLRENPKASLRENPKEKEEEGERGIKGGGNAASRPSRPPLSRKSLTAPNLDETVRSAAKKLQTSLRGAGEPARGSLEVSANDFRLLRDTDRQVNWERVLDAYCRVVAAGDRKELGLPVTENGKQFRRLFTWVKDKLEKAGLLGPEDAKPRREKVETRLPGGRVVVTYRDAPAGVGR